MLARAGVSHLDPHYHRNCSLVLTRTLYHSQVVQSNVVKATLLQVVILVSAWAIKPIIRASESDHSTHAVTRSIFYVLFHVSPTVLVCFISDAEADMPFLDHSSSGCTLSPERPFITADYCNLERRQIVEQADLARQITMV